MSIRNGLFNRENTVVKRMQYWGGVRSGRTVRLKAEVFRKEKMRTWPGTGKGTGEGEGFGR